MSHPEKMVPQGGERAPSSPGQGVRHPVFEEWYRLHGDRTVSLAQNKFTRGDRDAAEDLVQTTIMKYLHTGHDLPVGELRSYINGSLGRNWIDELRRRSQRPQEMLVSPVADNDYDSKHMYEDSPLEKLVGAAPSAEEQVIEEISGKVLEKRVRDTIGDDFTAPVLLHADGYNASEQAGMLGIKSSTVRTRLFRGRSQLKQNREKIVGESGDYEDAQLDTEHADQENMAKLYNIRPSGEQTLTPPHAAEDVTSLYGITPEKPLQSPQPKKVLDADVPAAEA